MKLGSVFSGVGGLELGLERALGATTVWQVEQDPYCLQVLEKHWPGVPIFEDVRNLKESDVGAVDVICGGFPCQDISLANAGANCGLEGARSGLWSEFFRKIEEHRPAYAIIENSPVLRSKGLDQILHQLSTIRYDAEWHCIPATAVDAPHSRDRVWIIAYPSGLGNRVSEGQVLSRRHFVKYAPMWSPEPPVRRVADGVRSQSHRLKALGNAVVPQIPEMIGHAILEAGK